jgi:hypothetical protein
MAYTNFIWMNIPLMYFIDIVIITSAIFALVVVFELRKIILGKFQKSILLILSGILLIALNYLMDAFAMLIGNMPLMIYLHHNIFWLTTGVGFMFITIGFYTMREVIRELEGK